MYINILIEEYKRLVKLETKIKVLKELIDDGTLMRFASDSDRTSISKFLDEEEE